MLSIQYQFTFITMSSVYTAMYLYFDAGIRDGCVGGLVGDVGSSRHLLQKRFKRCQFSQDGGPLPVPNGVS